MHNNNKANPKKDNPIESNRIESASWRSWCQLHTEQATNFAGFIFHRYWSSSLRFCPSSVIGFPPIEGWLSLSTYSLKHYGWFRKSLTVEPLIFAYFWSCVVRSCMAPSSKALCTSPFYCQDINTIALNTAWCERFQLFCGFCTIGLSAQ